MHHSFRKGCTRSGEGIQMKSKNEVVGCLSAPLCICDSTLGFGEQAAGAVFSNIEKYRIAQLLDDAGVPQIEAGNPILGTEEKKAVRHIARMGLDASVMAWNRADIGDINASIECDVDSVTIALPSQMQHPHVRLHTLRTNTPAVADRFADSPITMCWHRAAYAQQDPE